MKVNSDELDWADLKRNADNSLYVFNKEVLGYRDMATNPHREMCGFAQEIPFGIKNPERYRVLLVPRGAFKSSLVTIGYTLWLLTKFPEISILISSETCEKSESFLSEIKDHIETNQKYQRLYGYLKGDKLWAKDKIMISTRRKPHKTPSVATTGVDGSKTSQHFDIIIPDDLHSEKNYRTPALVTKVTDHISALLPILKPHGFMLFVGTRWGTSDAYSWIIENFPMCKTLIRSWKNDGELYFPSKLTEDYVMHQKGILASKGNSKLFYAWYENNPIASDIVSIKPEWRRIEPFVFIPHTWDYGYIYPKGVDSKDAGDEKKLVRVCGIIDPADTNEKINDANGITIKGIDKDGNWWVIVGKRLWGKSNVSMNTVIDLAKQYKVSTWGVETTGGRKLYREVLQQKFLDLQMYCRVLELKSGNRAKSMRIDGITGRFEIKSIIIHTSQTDLIEELDYPEVSTDDVIDSLAYHNMMDVNKTIEEQVMKEIMDDPYMIHPDDRKKESRLYSTTGRDPHTGY